MPRARRVLIVGYDDVELLDVACPSDVFDAASRLKPDAPYQVELATVDGRPIRCGSGLTLATHRRIDQVRGPLDTLLVAGGFGHRVAAADVRLTRHIRRLAAVSRRVASVCTGATVLAESGLLAGRRATTHWFHARQFAENYPEVHVDPAPLFIRDGDTYTAAGVTSGLDLALAFVQDDHGASLAREVARHLVVYLQRPGNQAQVSLFLAAPPPERGPVAEVAAHIAAHLAEDLSTGELAAVAGVSTRHLGRLFEDQLGSTPGRYVRTVRAEAAAQLLATTPLPLPSVARRCGFRSTETLRQAFGELYGTSPSAYRKAFTTKDPV